jgi:hypothetical protein
VDDTTEKQCKSQLSTRLFNKLKPENLKLPDDDSRKATHLYKQRRSLLMELRGYANSDGTQVRVAVKSLAESLGFGQRTIYRLLDDLKKLDLLVDEGRMGFNKPMRRHLNLARAAQLARISVAERPKNLPACIPTDLWQQFAPLLGVNGWDVEGSTNHVLAAIEHEFHLWEKERAEFLVVEYLRFSIKVRFITNELWQNFQLECNVKGCEGYQPEVAEVA